jgi:putative membrane protein
MESGSNCNQTEIIDGMSPSRTVARSIFGGILMGLANLVPGISGGTMLLVTGIYPQFIGALANATRLRLTRESLLVLGGIGLSAGLSILIFAGLLRDLVLDHRWIMYSLFVGLTLGGLPLVWRMARPASANLIVAASCSFGGMVILAILQFYGFVGSTGENGFIYFTAGLFAATAMVLPGISGGYLLLLLGKYVPILSAIDQFKTALTNRDVSTGVESLKILMPVGVGVVLGILLVGNLLKWLLQSYPKIILGVLLGLLLGSVGGLYPFQEGVPPEHGDIIKGVMVTAENIGQFKKKDWLIEFRLPSLWQAFVSLVLIAIGLGVTKLIAALGSESIPD